MKIKVCGLKYPDNIEAVAALQPDFIGVIFYKPSPRYVDTPEDVTMANIPSAITKTAVFVNETIDYIDDLVFIYDFDAIQLHGSETPEFCKYFKDITIVIKAFGIDEAFDFKILNDYKDVVDFFLFDAKTPIHGGSGNTFNWSLLNDYQLEVPFFLSGGIALENLNEITKINHPQFYGVDLNSRFETEPGLKDISKLKKAFELIKHTTDEIRG